jgi:hypothetical protein
MQLDKNKNQVEDGIRLDAKKRIGFRFGGAEEAESGDMLACRCRHGRRSISPVA